MHDEKVIQCMADTGCHVAERKKNIVWFTLKVGGKIDFKKWACSKWVCSGERKSPFDFKSGCVQGTLKVGVFRGKNLSSNNSGNYFDALYYTS